MPPPVHVAPLTSWACALVLAVLFPAQTAAQETDTTSAPAQDVRAAPPDTASSAPLLDLGATPPPPTSPSGGEGGLKQPVAFAGDSLLLNFDEEGGDTGNLFGEAAVTYGDTKLNAHRVDILFEIDELRASGLPSDTGMVGRPQFQEGGGETFYGNRLAYNLGTERGRVVVAQTQIEDGFISGEVIKVTEDSTVYAQGASYTTCDCPPGETPSYSLRASRMKRQDEWIYTGPIQLFLFNIPTPLWLPFGFLPATEGRRSGPLPPNYGEDDLGFFLRNWGWYWAMSDYFDLQVTAGIWTKGSWQITPRLRYNKRYRYSGNLQVDYVRQRRGERGDPPSARSLRNTVSIRWGHRQELSPTFDFNSNVNLSSTSYLRTVSESYNDRVTQTIQSSITLSKRWPGAGRSLNLSANQQQNLANNNVDLTLPSLNFTQGSRKPFERDVRPAGAKERFYERITYSYNSRLSNRYTFDPLSVDTLLARGDTAAAAIAWYEALVSPEKYRRATGENVPFNFQASHSIPVSAPFSIRRLPIINKTFILNVSPSFSYTEDWFISTERHFIAPDDTTGRVVRESVPGFFALRQFSSGVSANTTFYGIFPIKLGAYEGIRHTVRPTLSFNYQPDFSSDFWGYTRTYRNRNDELVEYPIASGVRSGLQQAISFSLSNVFETKRVERDSTGAQRDQTLKLLNVDARTSYNFAADSLKLAPISLSARTRILGEVDVQFSSSFSPYKIDLARGREINEYVFSPRRLRLARLTRLNLTARTDLRSKRSGGGRPYEGPGRGAFGPNDPAAVVPPGVPPLDPNDPFAPDYYDDGAPYTDFAIPWSLNLSFTYTYAPARTLTQAATRSAILNAGFDFSLTPNWKITGNSGYDFSEWELSTTSLRILRDFECWQMSISWVPFGQFQSYSFNLQVKSGKLSDLLRISQPRSGIRDRFDGAFRR